MDATLKTVLEYVYDKYVEEDREAVLDMPEAKALEMLEAHLSSPDRSEDLDCLLPGVLAFDLGWVAETEEERERLLRRAHVWLQRYRTLTGEPEALVDDRLSDLASYFEQRGIAVEAPAEAPAAPPAPPAPPAPVGPPPTPVFEAVYAPREIDDHGPMMLVPAGPFLFGDPKRAVTLPAFYIDKFPVTNRQFEQFCRATNYRFPKYIRDERFANPDAPVVGVSIADVQKFARWVGKSLPSEEQWEKASRGVDGRPYPWGEAPADATRACHGRDPAKDGTQIVMATPAGASPYGVRDLAGNVWEWTNTAIEDGETLHVIKGGCYNDPPELLRCDTRLEAGPKDKYENIGFRLVKSA